MEHIVDQINQAGIFTSEGFGITFDLIVSIFWPTFIGGLIVGIINGAIFYVLTLKLVRLYQLKRHKRRLAWKEILEQQPTSDVHTAEEHAQSD